MIEDSLLLFCESLKGIEIEKDGALEIASRSRGTPRIANRLLKRVRDFATVEGDGAIDGPTAVAARRQMDIDELGLDELDRSVLRAIIELYGGGPVGLDTLAANLGHRRGRRCGAGRQTADRLHRRSGGAGAHGHSGHPGCPALHLRSPRLP